jgi:hypothetical protein
MSFGLVTLKIYFAAGQALFNDSSLQKKIEIFFYGRGTEKLKKRGE